MHLFELINRLNCLAFPTHKNMPQKKWILYLFKRQLYFIWEEAPSREITPRVCDLQRPLVQESLGKYTYALMTISIVFIVIIIIIIIMFMIVVIKVTVIIIIIIITSAGVAGEIHLCSEVVHSCLWWQSPLHCDDDDLSPAGFPILKAGLDFLFEHLEISWRQSQYKPFGKYKYKIYKTFWNFWRLAWIFSLNT